MTRTLEITRVLAVMELKIRYYGSALGYLWSLLRPLMLFLVLYLVFTEIVPFGDEIKDYPVKLFLGLVLFSYFGDVTNASLGALVEKADLLRALDFPRVSIPLSVAVAESMHLCLNMLVVMAFILLAGIEPTAGWLELVPLLALLIAFTVAISLPLSLLYVRFRDVNPIWGVLSQLIFWGTPLVYMIETAPENLREPMMLNPLAVIVTQLRHSMIDPSAPTAAEAAGGAGWLLIPLAITAALMAFGVWIYRRRAATVAEAPLMAEPLPTDPADPRLRDWYHTIELGNGLVTEGHYDHRPVIDRYGIPEDLSGLTALDVGAGDGFFSFEMERRGAKVLAVDVPDFGACDWVPRMRRRLSEELLATASWPPRFRLAREMLGSGVEYEAASVYELTPERFGTFDLVFCGSLLLHLQHPLGALHAIRSVTAGTAVVETAIDRSLEADPERRPLLSFGSRDAESEIGELNSYWLFSSRALEDMLLYADFARVRPQPPFELPPRGTTVASVLADAGG